MINSYKNTKEEQAISLLQSLPLEMQKQACWMMKGIAITNSNGNNNFFKNIINLKRKQENFNY